MHVFTQFASPHLQITVFTFVITTIHMSCDKLGAINYTTSCDVLHVSGMLRSAVWWVVTDVSGQTLGPIPKREAVQQEHHV